MKLAWTLRARDDLKMIGRYIAEDDPGSSRRWVARLQERARAASRMPLSGRRVPEVGRDNVREVFLRTYRIIYRVKRTSIEILTVFEGHRPLPLDVED